jgi:hypothetical protein
LFFLFNKKFIQKNRKDSTLYAKNNYSLNCFV